mgnify:CR=1 FL=1
MREVMIAGVGTVKFGSFPDIGNYVHATHAIMNALKDADISWKQVQAAFCGSVYQGTGSGHQALREIGLSGIPIVNVENACSSGTSAFRLAYQTIASGLADIAIALGFEKLPKGAIPSTAFRPWQLAQGFNVQPANYALETMEYMHKYGATIDMISAVTIKNRKHATMNPNARFQKEVTLEEINASRMIASPLRLYHCAPTADGATCIVLMATDKVSNPARAIKIRAATMVSGKYGDAFYQNGMVESVKFPTEVSFTKQSILDAYDMAGVGPEDIDVIQAYDSMAPSELWDLEYLGFAKPGEAGHMVQEGYFSLGGTKPSNTDGGLMGRGHPLGATGTTQIYEIVTQLRGEAGARQVEGARLGITHTCGAGPNSAVTILEK